MAAQSQVLLSYGASGPFSPPSSGLQAHYDASISSSVTIVTGVSKWADQSGNGNDLLQATTSKQPTYSGSGMSSIITFNGSNNALATTAFTLNQPITVYLVGNQISWVVGTGLYDGFTADTMILYSYPGTPHVEMYAGGFGPDVSWTLGSQTVLTSVWNNTLSTMSINDGTKSTGTTGSSNPGGFTLGSGANATSGNFGHIGVSEVYIYNTAHSSSLQTQMVTYLRSKWGI